MVAYYHQRALCQLHINTAGGVSQNQRLDAKQFESANGKGDLFERVAFVEMYTTLHCQHRHLINFPNHQTTGVSLSRGTCKTGNVFVRNSNRFLEVVSKSAEAATQHYCHTRSFTRARPNDASSVFGALVKTRTRHLLCH